MTKMQNVVQLIGRIGKDPVVKELEEGKKVVNFSIATDDSYRDKEGNKVERTDWHYVVAFRGTADIIAAHVKKGDKIGLKGALKTRSYDAENGEKKYVTEVIADQILFLSEKKDSSPQEDQ
jgi:single-strand DNA-binding protein